MKQIKDKMVCQENVLKSVDFIWNSMELFDIYRGTVCGYHDGFVVHQGLDCTTQWQQSLDGVHWYLVADHPHWSLEVMFSKWPMTSGRTQNPLQHLCQWLCQWRKWNAVAVIHNQDGGILLLCWNIMVRVVTQYSSTSEIIKEKAHMQREGGYLFASGLQWESFLGYLILPGQTLLVVCGGRTEMEPVLGDVHFLDLETKHWTEVCGGRNILACRHWAFGWSLTTWKEHKSVSTSKECLHLSNVSKNFNSELHIYRYCDLQRLSENLSKLTLSQISVEGVFPEARHSHSSCAYQEGVVIFGGLGGKGIPLGDTNLLKATSKGFCWETLQVQPPVLPRCV